MSLITREHVNKISLIGLLVLLISSAPNYGEIPAFPGAMTTGGRGGDIIKVTNLNDSVNRSFRVAVESPDPHPNTISLHHNFLAHNTSRSSCISSPSGVDTRIEYINKVSYNWNGGSAPLQRGNAQVIAIYNFSKQVPNSNSYSFEMASSWNVSPVNPIVDVYGNIRSTGLKQTGPQWHVGKCYLDELLSETSWHLTPWPTLTTPVMLTEMSFDYSESIMFNMGALKSFRDAVDTRLIGQDLSGTGQIINNVVFPDDFITFKILSPTTDSDNYRIPNQWETANNLNPSVSDDNAMMPTDYTAIEAYINELADPPIILSTNDLCDNHNIFIFPNPTSNKLTIILKEDVLIKA